MQMSRVRQTHPQTHTHTHTATLGRNLIYATAIKHASFTVSRSDAGVVDGVGSSISGGGNSDTCGIHRSVNTARQGDGAGGGTQRKPVATRHCVRGHHLSILSLISKNLVHFASGSSGSGGYSSHITYVYLYVAATPSHLRQVVQLVLFNLGLGCAHSPHFFASFIFISICRRNL